MEFCNLLSNLPTSVSDELIEVLAENQHVRIERIVSHGHTSPEALWYDQDEHEWVIVLNGEAKLLFENQSEPRHMKMGDHILIPAHQKHRVIWTTLDEPTIWLAVFYRADQK